jgi:hypothetical protein
MTEKAWRIIFVGGAIKNGRVPSASEAAADTSLSGIVEVTDMAGYKDWKAAPKMNFIRPLQQAVEQP